MEDQAEGGRERKRAGRRLTKRTLDSLKPKAKPFRVYDTDLCGFFVTVTPKGTKTLGVRFGPRNRRRWLRIGAFGEMTLEAAREAAGLILAKSDLGQDPVAERAKRRAMPTFGEWATACLQDLDERRKRPEEIRRYVVLARRRWERRPLDEITPGDLKAFHASLGAKTNRTKDGREEKRKTPARANRALAHVGALFSAAVRQRVIPLNPAALLEKYRENPPRSRVLSEEELVRLTAAIAAEPDIYARAALLLALETGARIGEVLAARWTDLDLEEGRWTLPDPKAGRMQTVILAPETAEELKTLPRVSPFVIAGEIREGEEKARYDLKGPWERIRQTAGLHDVTIHDMRRTFGRLVARSAGLHVASRLLRHSKMEITARHYAPEMEAELRGAVSRVLPFLRPDREKKSA